MATKLNPDNSQKLAMEYGHIPINLIKLDVDEQGAKHKRLKPLKVVLLPRLD